MPLGFQNLTSLLIVARYSKGGKWIDGNPVTTRSNFLQIRRDPARTISSQWGCEPRRDSFRLVTESTPAASGSRQTAIVRAEFPRTGLKRTRKVPFAVDRRRKSLFLNGTRHPAPSSFHRPARKAGTERKCSGNSGKWRNRVDTRLHGRLCVRAPAEGRK